MKKIFSIAACLVLVASLALPAFAATFPSPIPSPIPDGSFSFSLSGSQSFTINLLPNYETVRVVYYCTGGDIRGVTYESSGTGTCFATGTTSPYEGFTNNTNHPGLRRIDVYLQNTSRSAQGFITVSYTGISHDYVTPSFGSSIAAGHYSASFLNNNSEQGRIYVGTTAKEFVFSNVVASDTTGVYYALTSANSSVTYHKIGDLVDGFSFSSAEYPVASYFVVRDSASHSVSFSYELDVSDDGVGKSSSIALSIWETCLAMGTAAITWITTGTNFIALIPIAMMLLVFAVLCIRKLIKGV